MEWKTAPGGNTTLHLEPDELTLLHQRSDHAGFERVAALRHFTEVRRANPMAEFNEVLLLAFPASDKPAGVAPKSKAIPQDRNERMRLAKALGKHVALIEQRLAQAGGSIQVEALLLTGYATTMQSLVMLELADELFARLDRKESK